MKNNNNVNKQSPEQNNKDMLIKRMSSDELVYQCAKDFKFEPEVQDTQGMFLLNVFASVPTLSNAG